jgi:hypothetical protein
MNREEIISGFRDELILWLKSDQGVTEEKLSSLRNTSEQLLLQAQLLSEQAGAILDILEHPDWVYPQMLKSPSNPGDCQEVPTS